MEPMAAHGVSFGSGNAPMPIEDMFVQSHGRYDRKTGRAAS
jgi:hypothetical protein